MLSEEETQDIDQYLGELERELPKELDSTQRQAMRNEATRLRAWTRRELVNRKDEIKNPPVKRQLIYGILMSIFCYVMAGVFYCALIPEDERNPMIILPMLILLFAGQTMGRCQQLRLK